MANVLALYALQVFRYIHLKRSYANPRTASCP